MESILIGEIVNIHGIKGEVKIYPYTDDIINLTTRKELFLDETLTKKITVQSSRAHKNMIIAKLKGIDDTNTALTYKNKKVYISKDSLEDLEEDTYYIVDLIGLEVVDLHKGSLGVVTYVFQTGANDVYEVEKEGNKIYLPAIHDVIKKVDLKNKKILVEVMDGLL